MADTSPPAPQPVACESCGRTAATAPLEWTSELTDRGRRYYCEQCARQHIRGIESRLDAEWW
ncbi:hypothetical protein [Nakamurella aerolata]|uniref:Uncharacterized protein n=1 Tax=Nakamurella aerolata TaxID=1656892 RepID=A0A849A945_9ACTN|nr:hypothetical protein [Nakamurella aerolata]NNG37065.1 hypothetical protein [Nakamurella aerolata]